MFLEKCFQEKHDFFGRGDDSTFSRNGRHIFRRPDILMAVLHPSFGS
jgi:hypothetical protein